MIFLQYFSERKVQQTSKNHSWKLEYAEGLQEKTKIQQLCAFVQFYLLYQKEQNVSNSNCLKGELSSRYCPAKREGVKRGTNRFVSTSYTIADRTISCFNIQKPGYSV
jgi:hypothetical protein